MVLLIVISGTNLRSIDVKDRLRFPLVFIARPFCCNLDSNKHNFNGGSIMHVTLVSTSDVHGYFRADDFRRPLLNTRIGLSRAVTAMNELRAQATADDVVIAIDNGDFIQGSPLTNYIEKIDRDDLGIYNDLANAAGFDVRILGNHEFNYGRDYLEAAMVGVTNLLNANILDETTGEPFIGKPFTIINRNHVRIGIIGLTTSYIPHWEHPDNIRGLVFTDPVETAQRYIPELRPNVDILVLAYHGGFSHDLTTGKRLEVLTTENQGYELLQLPGVDALITGHQHRAIANVVNGVPTTQPGYRGEYVGAIDLELDNTLHTTQADAQLIATGDYKEHPAILDLVAPLNDQVNNWLDTAIGTVSDNMQVTDHFDARLHNHPIIELVNQVQMAATGTHISNTALFNDEVRGLPNEVTRRDVMTNYIYPNTLVVEELTGQNIKDALEISGRYFTLTSDGELPINPRFLEPKVQHYNYDIWSGIDYTFDFSRPAGNRVTALLINGQPMAMTDTFEVTMNNYRATGTGNYKMYSIDKVIREVQIETADLIGDYIADHPDIQIAQPTNITSKGFVGTNIN